MTDEKRGIEIRAFGGINKQHTRLPGEPSGGMNFCVKNGSIYTREGYSYLTGANFSGSIRSLHTAKRVQLTTRVIAEVGTTLYHTLDGVNWQTLKTGISGSGFSSTVWGTPFGDFYLVMVNGPQALVYSIDSGTISNMVNNDGEVPKFEFVTNWRGFVWGWAPNYPNSNQIRFCGYDENERVSIDYWPLDFAIVPSSDPGEPIISAHPFGTHLFVLTTKAFYRVYGYSEENFESGYGGEPGVFGLRCSALLRDCVVWLGSDMRVYAYTGTSAYCISDSIDELLKTEDFSSVRAYGFSDQFWLTFPSAAKGETKVYVYDLKEKAWFLYVYPEVMNCGCFYGDFLGQERKIFGLANGKIALIGGNSDNGLPIKTEFILGPLYIDSRKFKAKRLWFNAEPRTNFTLYVSTEADDGEETEQGEIEFEAGNQITKSLKLSSVKGRDITIKVSTSESVNELQSCNIIIIPKQLK